MNVAIEMSELQYKSLESLINNVLRLQASYDALNKKMMDIQNDCTSTLSEFNTVMNEMQVNTTEQNRILLEFSKTVVSNYEFYDIVKIGDADE